MFGNWKLYALIGVILLGCYGWHVSDKRSAIELNTEVVKASMENQYQEKLDKAVADAIKSTKDMQADADKLKEDKYAKIEANNVQLSADYKRLQLRANRPSPEKLPNTLLGGETCTARELYKEDAEFLTGEAARAESVLIERDYYYERYESARKRIDEFANSK